MILGLSAGTVAAMSIEKGVSVQDVAYEDLKQVLISDGQVLSMD